MKHVASIFTILFFLTACKTTFHQNAGSFYIANNLKSKLIPLHKFQGDVTISNIMESNYKNSSYTANSIVKISKEEMKVIALSDISRIFTISFKGGKIDSEFSVLVPAKDVAPHYILSDIQMIYFPESAIASSLPTEMKMVQSQFGEGIKREFYCKNQKVIIITYSLADLFKSDIEFQNLERSYSYKIKYIGD